MEVLKYRKQASPIRKTNLFLILIQWFSFKDKEIDMTIDLIMA